jgi:UDP-glucose 4-epimerase
MKNVLVTGGSGFLGSHVADALSEANHKVRVYDREESPYLREDQEMVIGDILDTEALRAAMEGCHAVLHFAAIADIDDGNIRPSETLNVNVMGTVNALEAAILTGVERFVFASSVYVYSKFGGFYRASKQCSEAIVETYADTHNIDFTVVRYGSLYGRRANEKNSIFRMIEGVLENGALSYKGSSDAVREYIHVLDAAALTVKALEARYTGRHVVLSGAERLQVKELMEIIAEISPHPVKISIDHVAGEHHYRLTPYSFNPKVGHKLVATDYVELGQGILDCFAEAFERRGGQQDQADVSSSS